MVDITEIDTKVETMPDKKRKTATEHNPNRTNKVVKNVGKAEDDLPPEKKSGGKGTKQTKAKSAGDAVKATSAATKDTKKANKTKEKKKTGKRKKSTKDDTSSSSDDVSDSSSSSPSASPSSSSSHVEIRKSAAFSKDNWQEHQAAAEKYRKFVGGHMSAAGGAENAVTHCRKCDGMAFALFLKNQRRWDAPPMKADSVNKFKENCKDILHLEAFGTKQKVGAKSLVGNGKKYGFILPHGSYLINLANQDAEKRSKAFESFLDDLRRCEDLGIGLYNFHPGSTLGEYPSSKGIKNIADNINAAHKQTSSVVIVLENMAGQKNVLGSKFEDLRDIIKLVDNKDRVGVCLDTCHLFAAGYDIRLKNKQTKTDMAIKEEEGGASDSTTTDRMFGEGNNFDKVMREFDEIVGLSYLRSIHLNDSKSDLGSGLDRHEQIGKGRIGLESFRFVMNDDRFNDIPIVLETPDEKGDSLIWKEEIHLLYSLIEK